MTLQAPASAERDATLALFLYQLKNAFDRSTASADVKAMVETLWSSLKTKGAKGSTLPEQKDVCKHLPDALAYSTHASPHLAKLARSIKSLAPMLAWKARASGGPNSSDNWPDGHANAVILGKGGLEEHDNLALGLSLLAPHVRYPDHTHPPEEAYFVLTPGRFQNSNSDWFQPGVGGTLFNPANIVHAMASDEAPLLAIWCHVSDHTA